MNQTVKVCLVVIISMSASYLIVGIAFQNSNTLNLNEITNIQYEYVLSAMMDLKPEYIEQINQMTFSGNQTWIADQCESEEKIIYKGESYLTGCHHSFVNKIFIYVSHSEQKLRKTLCHEILHEVMNLDGDEEEDIAYMIDNSGICYKDDNTDFNIRIKDYNISENSTIKIVRKDIVFLNIRSGNMTINSSL